MSMGAMAASAPEAPIAPELESKLRDLAALPADWDSYGASPPTPIALAAVRTILGRLSLRLAELAPVATPYAIAPLHDGGMQIEWRSSGASVEVGVDPAGRLAYLVETCLGTERLSEERSGVSVSEIVTVVAGVLTSARFSG